MSRACVPQRISIEAERLQLCSCDDLCHVRSSLAASFAPKCRSSVVPTSSSEMPFSEMSRSRRLLTCEFKKLSLGDDRMVDPPLSPSLYMPSQSLESCIWKVIAVRIPFVPSVWLQKVCRKADLHFCLHKSLQKFAARGTTPFGSLLRM